MNHNQENYCIFHPFNSENRKDFNSNNQIKKQGSVNIQFGINLA